MLSLKRRKGESIIIDHRITVKVYQIQGDTVTLSIDAPREVSVHRKEIEERIQKQGGTIGAVDTPDV